MYVKKRSLCMLAFRVVFLSSMCLRFTCPLGVFFIASTPCYEQSIYLSGKTREIGAQRTYVYSYTYDCDLVDHKSLHRSGSLSLLIEV